MPSLRVDALAALDKIPFSQLALLSARRRVDPTVCAAALLSRMRLSRTPLRDIYTRQPVEVF